MRIAVTDTGGALLATEGYEPVGSVATATVLAEGP